MRLMKRISRVWAFLFFTFHLFGQTNVPVKLALIAETDEARPAVDVLTAALSNNGNVQLLERDEIEKVYQEQGMSAMNSDYLKLGRILGADGVLTMEIVRKGADQYLDVRLIAVKPGVMLSEERYSWPVKDLAEWVSSFTRRLQPQFPKLTVLAKDAIPISVVNLRSAIQSGQEQDTEQQLKLLVIERLSRERSFFILDREKMQLLGKEKELNSDESAFWDGSYLLEGTIDRDGYSKAVVTVNVRLTPSKGGVSLLFQVSGSRTNLTDVANSLAGKIAELLKVHSSVMEWNAADEAEQYFDEAKWAARWGLNHAAQEASEAAWGLGKRTQEVATLRLKSYLNDAPVFTRFGPPRFSTMPPPNPADLGLAQRVLELFNDGTSLFTAESQSNSVQSFTFLSSSSYQIRGPGPGIQTVETVFTATNTVSPAFSNNVEWFDLGLKALNMSDAVLQNFNESAEARAEHALQLADLRFLARQTEAVLESNVPAGRGMGGVNGAYSLTQLKWEDGGLWYDTPEEGLAMDAKMLESGFRTCDTPKVIAWSWEDRKRIPSLLKQFAEDLSASTNQDLQLEGLLYQLSFTPYDSSGRLEAAQNKLYDQIWEQRQTLFDGRPEASIMGCIEGTLRGKYGSQFEHERMFHDFRQHLRKDYLENAPEYNKDGFDALFSSSYTQSEIAELAPLVDDFKKRLRLSSKDSLRLDRRWEMYANSDNYWAGTRRDIVIPMKSPPGGEVKPVVANFDNWKLNLPRMNDDLRPVVLYCILRKDKLWAEIEYSNPEVGPDEFRAFFFSYDLRTGTERTIAFPSQNGLPSDSFEVTDDSLYVMKGNHLERFQFQINRWEAIPVPIEGRAKIIESGGRIYLANPDAILELNPDTQAVQILASSRRRPAVNELDKIGGIGGLSRQSDGKLVLFAGQHFFTFSPANDTWTEVLDLSNKTNWFLNDISISDKGLLYEETYFPRDTRLFAWWNGESGSELLLDSPWYTNMQLYSSAQFADGPPQWDWPSSYSLPVSTVMAEGKALWVLHPNKARRMMSSHYQILNFDDNRNATAIRFEPGFRQAMPVPIRFEKDGHPIDPFNEISIRYPTPGEPIDNPVLQPFALDSDQGIVVVSQGLTGDWLIPRKALESRLQILRKMLADESTRNSSPKTDAKELQEP